MRIEFDTENLSKVDYQILAVLGDVATSPAAEAEESTKPAPRKRAAAKPAPAPTPDEDDEDDVNTEEANDRPAPRKRAATKPKAKPAPEPDEDEDDEDEDGGQSLRDQVTARVTDLVASGKAKQVKAALADLGVAKASELDEDQLEEFLESVA